MPQQAQRPLEPEAAAPAVPPRVDPARAQRSLKRLRLLRVLLPAALVVLVVLIVLALRERTPVHGAVVPSGVSIERRMEGFYIVEDQGGERVLEARGGLAQQVDGGRLHLEQIEELKLNRVHDNPLIISASIGDIEGEVGDRTMRFEDQVVMRDPVAGLLLKLPNLDVEETLNEARSSGEVHFEGPHVQGVAESMVYPLDGRPAELRRPVFEDQDGGRLTADLARLLDGLDDVELEGQVRATRDGEYLDTQRLRVIRGPDDRLRKAVADGGVDGTLRTSAGSIDLRAAQAEILWDRTGEVEDLKLEGAAELRRGGELLSASTLGARRDAALWVVDARGGVYLQATLQGAPAWMRSERLDATLLDEGLLQQGMASGKVVFDAPDTHAEADRARFAAGDPDGEIQLFSDGATKARLARERTRVAAERIATDVDGGRLEAEGRVEATLMPQRDGDRRMAGLFRAEEAIHFVAAELHGRDSGRRLVFRGNVRGWQGEENLSAEEISIDQTTGTLKALRHVTTRFPRDGRTGGIGEADYVQIAAEALDYDDGRKRAIYEGQVVIRLVEGWLEADRVEVLLAAEGGGVESMLASGAVRIELRDDAEPGQAPRLIAGTADRVLYTPQDDTVLLYGDAAPASVQRVGDGGEKTTGRMLRYRLDVGTLEVDSGEQGSVKIRAKED